MNYLDCLDQVFPRAISRVIETYTCPTLFQCHMDWACSLSISSDNKYLYSGYLGNTIRQWSLETGESFRTLQGHANAVWSLSLSTDNQHLYSGSSDHTIRQWAVGNEPIGSSVEGPTGHTYGTGESLRVLQGHTGPVYCLALSSDNEYLFSGSYDTTIRQWAVGSSVQGPTGHTLSTGESLRTLQGHTGSVWSLALSSDNKYLYSGSYDGTIRQWAIGNEPIHTYGTGESLRIFQGHTGSVYGLALSSDNKYLYSGSRDQTIRQWAVGNEPIHTNGTGESPQTLHRHAGFIRCLVLSPDNKYLYSGSTDTIRRWSANESNVPSRVICRPQYTVVTMLCKHNDLFFAQNKDIHRIQLRVFQDGNESCHSSV